MRLIEPKPLINSEGRQLAVCIHVACPDCGIVAKIPHDEGDIFPWCNHGNAAPIWHIPHPDSDWTQMVHAVVHTYEAEPDPWPGEDG